MISQVPLSPDPESDWLVRLQDHFHNTVRVCGRDGKEKQEKWVFCQTMKILGLDIDFDLVRNNPQDPPDLTFLSHDFEVTMELGGEKITEEAAGETTDQAGNRAFSRIRVMPWISPHLIERRVVKALENKQKRFMSVATTQHLNLLILIYFPFPLPLFSQQRIALASETVEPFCKDWCSITVLLNGQYAQVLYAGKNSPSFLQDPRFSNLIPLQKKSQIVSIDQL